MSSEKFITQADVLTHLINTHTYSLRSLTDFDENETGDIDQMYRNKVANSKLNPIQKQSLIDLHEFCITRNKLIDADGLYDWYSKERVNIRKNIELVEKELRFFS